MQELWSNPWDSILMEIVTLETSWKTFLTRFLESKYQFVLQTAYTIFLSKWGQISELHRESYKFHKKFKLEVRKFCKYIGIKLKRSGRNVSTKRTTKHSVGFPNHTNVAKHKRICAHDDSHSAQDLNITRRTNNQIDSKMLLTCSQTRNSLLNGKGEAQWQNDKCTRILLEILFFRYRLSFLSLKCYTYSEWNSGLNNIKPLIPKSD